MRIAIFGTGGAGGYFGARLARAGEDVVFLARGEHLQAIRERGLRVESVDGDFAIHPAQATDTPAKAGPVDVVIVGVKAWQVSEAATAMGPLIGTGTVVVPLQNGVEAHDRLAAVVGPEHVLGGLARIFCFLVEPGHVRHLGGPASLTFGELDNRPSERAKRLRGVLSRAGVAADIPPDIHVALWEKFLFIVPFGGIGSVARAPIGTLRSLPETRRMLEQGMREIRDVARGRKIPLDDKVVARTMDFVDTLPADGTTSLQRDITAGRPSELEAWNGAVVRLGQETGVAAPLHDFLYRCLLPLERKARGEVSFPD
ncbi:MAG: 2-dehydropantoate 2-reductase [Verrucomicrobiota bacterium]